MTLSIDFKDFCKELVLDNLDSMIISAGEIAKKLNTKYYDLTNEKSENLYIVGSVGRNTAIKNNSI